MIHPEKNLLEFSFATICHFFLVRFCSFSKPKLSYVYSFETWKPFFDVFFQLREFSMQTLRSIPESLLLGRGGLRYFLTTSSFRMATKISKLVFFNVAFIAENRFALSIIVFGENHVKIWLRSRAKFKFFCCGSFTMLELAQGLSKLKNTFWAACSHSKVMFIHFNIHFRYFSHC